MRRTFTQCHRVNNLPNHWHLLNRAKQFGVWAALAIHDTSSVVATAQMYGTEAAEIATTVKIGRTLWLIPLIVIASLVVGAQQSKIRVPNFVFVFIGASLLGSWVGLSSTVAMVIGEIASALLVVALFFVGADITRKTLKNLRLTTVLHGIAFAGNTSSSMGVLRGCPNLWGTKHHKNRD